MTNVYPLDVFFAVWTVITEYVLPGDATIYVIELIILRAEVQFIPAHKAQHNRRQFLFRQFRRLLNERRRVLGGHHRTALKQWAEASGLSATV